MEAIQHIAATIFAFLDNTLVKIGLMAVGTFLLRKWPKFVNEAVPVWTLVSSIVLTLLHAIVPTTTSLGAAHTMNLGATNMELAGIFSSGGLLSRLFSDAILPWLLGYGGQRAGDHTKTWATGKDPSDVREEKKDNPPIVTKPFQTFVEG